MQALKSSIQPDSDSVAATPDFQPWIKGELLQLQIVLPRIFYPIYLESASKTDKEDDSAKFENAIRSSSTKLQGNFYKMYNASMKPLRSIQQPQDSIKECHKLLDVPVELD